MNSCTDPVTPQDSDSDLRLMIGQMIMIGFRGAEVSDTSAIVLDIKSGRVGGVVLFDKDVALGFSQRNIVSAAQVSELNRTLLAKSTKSPLLIAVDQEGGKVARLKPEYGFLPTVSQEYLGTLNNPDSTIFYGNRTAATLEESGFNFNFAPVVDLNVNPKSPAIGAIQRSFSRDPDVVVSNAGILINCLKNKNVLSCLKHFPGHGSASADSHQGFTDVTETWIEEELIPYRKLIEAGKVQAIMTAHVFNAKLDADYPATLSSKIVGGILRNQLKFDGVVISDDMNMKAISENFGLETALEKSINAGIDIVLFGNNLIYDEQIAKRAGDIIFDLVKKGKISKERIKKSYSRIMLLKNNLFWFI
jgi:beta-N-acetylhexosaminidase